MSCGCKKNIPPRGHAVPESPVTRPCINGARMLPPHPYFIPTQPIPGGPCCPPPPQKGPWEVTPSHLYPDFWNHRPGDCVPGPYLTPYPPFAPCCGPHPIPPGPFRPVPPCPMPGLVPPPIPKQNPFPGEPRTCCRQAPLPGQPPFPPPPPINPMPGKRPKTTISAGENVAIDRTVDDHGNIDYKISSKDLELTAQVERNTKSIQDLEQRVHDNVVEIARVDGHTVALDTRVTENSDNISTLADRVSGLETQVADNTMDIADLAFSVSDLTGTVSEIGTQVVQNTDDITDLDSRVTVNTNSINGIDGRLVEVENSLGELEGANIINADIRE